MDEELQKIDQEAMAAFRESNEFAIAQTKKAQILFNRLIVDLDSHGLKISHLIDSLAGYFYDRNLSEAELATEELLKLLPKEM